MLGRTAPAAPIEARPHQALRLLDAFYMLNEEGRMVGRGAILGGAVAGCGRA